MLRNIKNFGFLLKKVQTINQTKENIRNISPSYMMKFNCGHRTFAGQMGHFCANCNQPVKDIKSMICSGCGYLYDAPVDMGYFEILDIPATFRIDVKELSQKFRRLQTVVHPDKFAQKTNKEQQNSLDWSMLINEAYKTLVTPVDRGKYMLKQKGLEIPENYPLEPAFLHEMMELNEEVDNVKTKAGLTAITNKLQADIDEKLEKLDDLFQRNDIDKAMKVVIQLQYLLSLQTNIKKKHEEIDENDARSYH